MAGIYIHVPFCKVACHYCDFYFSTNAERKDEMISAIITEIGLQQNYLAQETIETIYFGGGTPSIVSSENIADILDTIRSRMNVSRDAEITLEANPDDLTSEKLHQLYSAGVNRLSIGIQSFNNDILKYLNRAHDSSMAFQCIAEARQAGFRNLSIDLIYAIPGQDDATWLKNIRHAVQLQPEHISAYSLTIEEKTVFGKWSAQGKLTAPPDDIAASQLELLVTELDQARFEHYEVSNFAQPGFISRHNSSYWRQKKYLGVGPSAHSYNKESRQYNISNNNLYLKAIAEGKIPATFESLSRADQINDYLLTTLRTSWGTDFQLLKKELDFDLYTIHKKYIDDLLHRKLALLENNHLILTEKGKMMADKISSDLFVST